MMPTNRGFEVRDPRRKAWISQALNENLKQLLGKYFDAFYYDQFEGDSGSGAKLGGFEGRTIGIGPALGYILPCGENTFVAEARWLPELETKRRLEWDFLWLKLGYQF